MNNLQLPHAKLLYFVAELWKQKIVTDAEKTLLKGNHRSLVFNLQEMVISDEPKIFELLEEYEEDQNEDSLREGVLLLARPKTEKGKCLAISTFPNLILIHNLTLLDDLVVRGNRTHEPPEQDDVSFD
jgi:hypothetical protein